MNGTSFTDATVRIGLGAKPHIYREKGKWWVIPVITRHRPYHPWNTMAWADVYRRNYQESLRV